MCSNNMNSFHHPPKILFPGQQPNEKIYLVTRQHWMILARQIFVWLLFVCLLLFLDGWVIPQFQILATSPFIQIITLFKTLYLMALVAGIFTLWVLYYLNYQIVTNERVVDIDQKNLLYHVTSELNLGSLEDVTVEVRGILANFFDFGTVYIQTAGTKRNFEFENIPNPHSVAKLILDLYEHLPQSLKKR